MKVHRSSKGPFLEQPYFSMSEIESLCVDELSRLNLLPSEPSPIRIDRFIEKRFGAPHSYEDLPEGVLGLTRFGPKGVEQVLINRGLEEDTSKPAERRLRTTLAHEAGHGLLHSHLFVLGQQKPLLGDWTDSAAPKVLCRDPAQYSGQWWEYQANMVMGSILLPRPLLLKALEPFFQASGVLGLPVLTDESRAAAIRSLGDVFDVNPVVVRIRLEKLFPGAQHGQLSL